MITAGEVIKNKRESLGKSIDTVSADTKIQRRFLQYIENNEFSKFDSEVFASGFLKIYSKYLGLDIYKILALYRRDNTVKRVDTKKKNVKVKKKGSINISPKAIGIITLSLFLLFVLGYIGFQIYKFQTPPELVITQPADEYISQEQTTTLKGSVKPPSLVEIDGRQIEVDQQGNFQIDISLKEGVNTITVRAKKESNQTLETSKSVKVVYTPAQSDEALETPVKEFFLTLTISQSSSWIKLDIDGVNNISQVLQPNTVHEFEVVNNFSLVTGRLQSTTLEINKEEITIPSSNNTGVGQISCEIVQGEIECE